MVENKPQQHQRCLPSTVPNKYLLNASDVGRGRNSTSASGPITAQRAQQRGVALKKAVLILHSNTSPQMQQRLGAVLTSHHRTSTPSTISGQRSLQVTGKLFSGLRGAVQAKVKHMLSDTFQCDGREPTLHNCVFVV